MTKKEHPNHNEEVCNYVKLQKFQKISKKDRFIMLILTLILSYFFLRPILTYSLFLNALSYENAGMLDEAIYKLNKAIKIYPDFSAAYSNLGLIYERMNQDKKALIYYKKALKKNNIDWLTYQGIASILLRKRDFKKIVQELYPLVNKKFLTQDFVLTLKILAVSCEKINNLDKAKKVWGKVYLLQPKDIQARQKIKELK